MTDRRLRGLAVREGRTTASGHARPRFLITIDTERDDAWSTAKTATTRNARFLPRFQALCERHGLRPTYLTNFQMAKSEPFIEFARDALRRGTAEIGMHLHAWDSPPIVPLTAHDHRFHPYLVEFPEPIMREKVGVMTELLEDTFAVKMKSHRAGRWYMNELYAKLLIELGYEIDCSVAPHVSWKNTLGDPTRGGGADYSRYPEAPYFVSVQNLATPGDSPLLELPMTIMRNEYAWIERVQALFDEGSLSRRALNRAFPPYTWLRPNGRNLARMLRLLDRALADGRSYVEFMLHSSELMPAGSPYFRDGDSIERLYADLEQLFERARQGFEGATLVEFRASYLASKSRAA